jgi:hypothetical protein
VNNWRKILAWSILGPVIAVSTVAVLILIPYALYTIVIEADQQFWMYVGAAAGVSAVLWAIGEVNGDNARRREARREQKVKRWAAKEAFEDE